MTEEAERQKAGEALEEAILRALEVSYISEGQACQMLGTKDRIGLRERLFERAAEREKAKTYDSLADLVRAVQAGGEKRPITVYLDNDDVFAVSDIEGHGDVYGHGHTPSTELELLLTALGLTVEHV